MKSASPALIAHLNSKREFIVEDLYTFTLNGGYVARYTSAEIDLKPNGNLFKKFRIRRGKTRTTVGIEVDTLDITLYPDDGDLLNGVSWIPAARRGALDGAHVLLERLYMPSWGDASLGALHWREGRVAEVKPTGTEVQIQVKSELELLDVKIPRNFYQSGCLNTLFDNACALSSNAFKVVGSVTAGSVTQFSAAAFGQAAGYFSLGKVTFLTGPNAGVTRSIRSFAGGVFVFATPLVTPPAPGDSFAAWPGCDKTKATCENKFSNVINFRGFPFVPDPETAT